MVKKIVLAPPDGGYGWVIVFAGGMNNFLIISLMQIFGLIFKDLFPQMGLTATQGSLIININAAFGMITGFINAPLLNKYGYKNVAFLGAALLSTGIILSSLTKSFEMFLITYSLMSSLGLRISVSAYNLAVNTYFLKNKTKAIGIMIFITGFGPVIMPQIIKYFIETQSLQGVILIVGGICLNSVAFAFLLQPVEKHMVQIEEDVDETNTSIDQKQKFVMSEDLHKIEEEAEEHEDNTQPLVTSGSNINPSQNSAVRGIRRNSVSFVINYEQESPTMFGLETTMGGSVLSLNTITSRKDLHIDVNQTVPDKSTEEEGQNTRSNFSKISDVFGLYLFKDYVYVNIMIGMSVALFAEMNFSNLTAFILTDLDMDTTQIATFMSTFGIADVIFRFFAPYIGEYLKQPPRKMLLYSFIASIIFRGAFLKNDYYYLLGIAICLGITRGIRSVYINLIIPHHVPLERLAAASGMQLVVNGVIIIILGPLSGIIRDRTGSYKWVIMLMNLLTMVTIIMWITELLYKCLLSRKSSKVVETI